MLPHQERVVEEKQALDAKIESLNLFIGSDLFYTLHEDEQGRLNHQLACMRGYTHMLDLRIQNF